MADPNDSLVMRRSKRSTAGNRMEAALAEFKAEDVGMDIDEDVDFVIEKDEEDVFGSDFESTDEEGAQDDVDAIAENLVRQEEKVFRRATRTKLDQVTAAAHARHKATFNPDTTLTAKPPTVGKVKRRVSMGVAIDVETGEIMSKRHSSRRHTMLNTSATVLRMRDAEEKKSAIPKKVKAKMRAPTQDELISRALDMEEGNIIEHRNYLTLEEEKRKKARVVRATVQGPLLRWVSRGEEITVKVEPVPQGSAAPPYGYTYPPPFPSTPGFPPTSYLHLSANVSNPNGSVKPPASTGSSFQSPATFVYHAYAPQPVLAPIERKEKVAKAYVVHEVAQSENTARPPWHSTMTAMFGDHVKWEDLRVYTTKGRPLSRPAQICPITGKIARYKDPRTGVPFANLEAVGRKGVGREVGMAALDKDTGRVALIQLADCPTYVKTLHQLHLHSPSLILVPDTFLSISDVWSASGGKKPSTTSLLVQCMMEEFDTVPIQPVMRKFWNENAGLEFVNQLTVEDDERAAILVAVSNKKKQHAIWSYWQHVEQEMRPSLFGLLNHSYTAMGARLLRVNILSPITVKSALEARLDVVEELIQSEERFNEIKNALKTLNKLDFDKLISALAASDAREYSSTAKPASARVSQMLNLRDIVQALPLLAKALAGSRSQLLQIIREMIMDERLGKIAQLVGNGLNEQATPAKGGVNAVNARVYAVKANYNRLLDVARETYKENVGDIYTLRNSLSQQFNIPLTLIYQDTGFVFALKKSDLEGELPRGFVNVTMQKGRWIFSSVELKKRNARMKDALDETLILSDKIIQDLTTEVVVDIGALYKASEAVALLDVLWSFAHASILRNYGKLLRHSKRSLFIQDALVRPEFTGTLAIKAGRHPVLESVQSAGAMVPNDVYCCEASSFQIVQGPNMSGKSTYLRQIGLLTTMAMCGCFVPAEYGSFRIHDALLSRLSNDDDIEKSLSTFANEMASSAMILGLATSDSLVLVDEVGRGTSTREGIGISHAIAESLINHFNELTTTLSRQPSVVNLHLAVQKSRQTTSDFGITFQYKIIDGAPEAADHYGLDLARLADLPDDNAISKKAEQTRFLFDAKLSSGSNSASYFYESPAAPDISLLQLRTQLTQALNHSSLPNEELAAYLARFQKDITKVLHDTLHDAWEFEAPSMSAKGGIPRPDPVLISFSIRALIALTSTAVASLLPCAYMSLQRYISAGLPGDGPVLTIAAMGNVVSKAKLVLQATMRLSETYDTLTKRFATSPGLPVVKSTLPFWTVPAALIPSESPSLPHMQMFPLNVIMLEARDVCSGATGRNGGHVNPPLYHDYSELKEKFGEPMAKSMIRFRQAHIREFIQIAATEDILKESQCREIEHLDVFTCPISFAVAKQNLAAWQSDMPSEASSFNCYDSKEAIERYHLSNETAGCISNDGGAMHPYRFVTSLLSILLDRYSETFHLATQTPCTSIAPPSSSSPFYAVNTPLGVVMASHVIHATNGWCSHLLEPMREKIIPARGNMSAQRPGRSLSPTTLDGYRSFVFYRGAKGYDYLTQLTSGEHELMFGGGWAQSCDGSLPELGLTDDGICNLGAQSHLAGALPLYFGHANWGAEKTPAEQEGDVSWSQGRTKAQWSGVSGREPPPLASAPVLDAKKKTITAAPGEWIAAGYTGEGMAHAWMSGKALAFMVSADKEDELDSWFPDILRVTEKRWKAANVDDLIARFL
ncbi:MutS 4 [Grifola frondosa]|uniref:MutS 4 n=1 Tax=Grifola frondosa TaxID=5627 RepID=A0A1C7MP10_GRIFR|nr:MutS 4 [Grifola frondosa]